MKDSRIATTLARLWRRIRVPLISLFIFYNTMSLVLWISPPFPFYWSMVSLIRPYVCYFGFWNQWQMFAHPKNWNIYLTANAQLDNGKTVVWDFPRMEKLDFVTRAFKERYREWAHEYVNEGHGPFTRPEACRFIARQVYNVGHRPVQIQLIRHWSWIQPPPGFGKSQPEGNFQYTFYTYNVSQEDLQ